MALFVGLALFLALSSVLASADAFPGVVVAKDSTARFVHTTEIVVMRHAGYSIVTVALDYEGPLSPFALVLPVPADVRASDVRTVKRGLIARLEELSAPRYHAFYEQDPCSVGPPEQTWQERLRARGRGFLTPEWVPPLDRHYAISNEIGLPVEPSFKSAENEFRYRDLAFERPEELRSFLEANGYRIGDAPLASLAPYLGGGRRLLLAEVLTDHVELVAPNRVELGGIRYASKSTVTRLPVTLGLEASAGVQDLFVYVLDRQGRVEARSYPNVLAPGNVPLDARAASRLAGTYNALYDAATATNPSAFVTEYVWSTRGCGEPCPDAPLGADELLTLGGDVLEAHTTTPSERAPPPSPESSTERRLFEAELAEKPASERPRVRREHERDRRELERRRALMARQTYVLTRLHRRYERASLPRDLELSPASTAVRGGVGVPKGSGRDVERVPRPADTNELQVRFVGFYPWKGEISCSEPSPGRWGKPWPSAARAARQVPLALGLPRQGRAPTLLTEVLTVPLPELGLLPAAAPPPPKPSVAVPSTDAAKKVGCGLCRAGSPGSAALAAFALALLSLAGARRLAARAPR